MKITMLAQTGGPTMLTVPLMAVANKVILITNLCAINFLADEFYSPVFR
jgi:hypothetical protein